MPIWKNSIYNLAGHALPFLVGFFAIPHIIQSIGLERFGILTIVWAVIGYFSLFDFGLSRTITIKISELLSLGKLNQINAVFWTSLKLIFLITLLGSAVCYIFSYFPEIFANKASPKVAAEGMLCLKVMALTLPAITMTAGIKGALEAHQQFKGLNIIQSIMGALNFLLPLVIAWSRPNLFLLVVALSALRFVFLAIHFVYLFKTSLWFGKYQTLPFRQSFPLLISGGWFTVSNIVGPIMIYFDRFFLAALVPSGQIAYYTTPIEIVNRLLLIPSSITRALFPVLASSKSESTKTAYSRAVKLIALLCAGVALVGLIQGRWFLKTWLGEDFAAHSASIFSIVLIGFLTNSLAWGPFALIQAFQRPDITAKVHLVELPIYCLLLFFLAQKYGIMGAAFAWTIRNTADFVILFFIAERLKKKAWKQD